MTEYNFPYVITDSRGEVIARFLNESDRDYALDALAELYPDCILRPKEE